MSNARKAANARPMNVIGLVYSRAVTFGDSRLPDRFWRKVIPGPGGCWIWQGALVDGYGYVRLNNKQTYAHRVTMEIEHGGIPADMEIDHLCRVRACCNPDPVHLEIVTHEVNQERMQRATGPRATHCPAGHEYAPGNLVRSAKHQACRECRNSRRRKPSQGSPRDGSL